jgi:hypothetical protein
VRIGKARMIILEITRDMREGEKCSEDKESIFVLWSHMGRVSRGG